MGNPKGKPLLFVHGYANGLAFWYRTLPHFTRDDKYHVHAIDMLGFGRSSRPAWQFTQDEHLEAREYLVHSIEEWRQQMDIAEQITVVAHSFGGYICGNYALTHPEKLDKLMMVSPFGLPDAPKRPRTRTSYSWLVDIGKELWERDINPIQVFRALGPLGVNSLQYFVSRRFGRLDEEERKLIAEYLHHLWAEDGSSEAALTTLFQTNGYARDPLGQYLPDLKVATYFFYGM